MNNISWHNKPRQLISHVNKHVVNLCGKEKDKGKEKYKREREREKELWKNRYNTKSNNNDFDEITRSPKYNGLVTDKIVQFYEKESIDNVKPSNTHYLYVDTSNKFSTNFIDDNKLQTCTRFSNDNFNIYSCFIKEDDIIVDMEVFLLIKSINSINNIDDIDKIQLKVFRICDIDNILEKPIVESMVELFDGGVIDKEKLKQLKKQIAINYLMNRKKNRLFYSLIISSIKYLDNPNTRLNNKSEHVNNLIQMIEHLKVTENDYEQVEDLDLYKYCINLCINYLNKRYKIVITPFELNSNFWDNLFD